MHRELKLRIILIAPPPGIDFGVQSGRGSSYTTLQTQRSTGKDVLFECEVSVKQSRNGDPDFAGPIVQGPPAERFLYIDIGTYAGQKNTQWSRRLKVPLRAITWQMIDAARAKHRAVLETRVPGTGSDGGPTCATVKPFAGWMVSAR